MPDAVPPEGQGDRGGDQQAAEAGEPGGEVAMLVRDRELTDRLLTAHMDDAISRLTNAGAVDGAESVGS